MRILYLVLKRIRRRVHSRMVESHPTKKNCKTIHIPPKITMGKLKRRRYCIAPKFHSLSEKMMRFTMGSKSR